MLLLKLIVFVLIPTCLMREDRLGFQNLFYTCTSSLAVVWRKTRELVSIENEIAFPIFHCPY